MDNKTPESQLRASRNYRKRVNEDEEKKAHRNYLAAKRAAKSFIKTKATVEDLEELKKLITTKINFYQKY